MNGAPAPSKGCVAEVANQPEPNGVVRVKPDQQKRVKLLSAVIGASAVVAIGAVAVAVANEQAGTGTVGSAPEATVGGTTTTTTTPPTTIVSPTMKAIPPKGFR